MQEVEHGLVCLDAFCLRGRKRSEDHLPNLLIDLKAVVESQSQADPPFRTNRISTRLTATEVRRQLITEKGYSNEQLPTEETIARKLNELGYFPKKVAKTQSQKTARIERCWSALEGYWNGSLLDSVDAVIRYASSMTWNGTHPLVELVTTVYQTEVKLTKEAMDALETQFERLPHLGKWFVDITVPTSFLE